MKSMLALVAGILISSSSYAALLTYEGKGPTVEKVALSEKATAQIEGESVTLTSIGSGLRAKKVVFVNVKVYVGQIFVSSPQTFKKNEAEALGSLKDQKAVLVQMHFLRNVDAENVRKSFNEALLANGVSIEDSAVKQFLESVSKGGEAKEGKTLTVLGSKLPDGQEMIIYETTEGNISQIKGAAGFIGKIFSIWLGKSTDDGIAQLKKSMLK